MPGTVCHLPPWLVDSLQHRLLGRCPAIRGRVGSPGPRWGPRELPTTLPDLCTPAVAAMSKLGKFFKGSRSSKSRAAPSPQEALMRLRETEEMLSKKQEYLENRIQRELSLAKKHGTQNKRGKWGMRFQLSLPSLFHLQSCLWENTPPPHQIGTQSVSRSGDWPPGTGMTGSWARIPNGKKWRPIISVKKMITTLMQISKSSIDKQTNKPPKQTKNPSTFMQIPPWWN